MVSSVVVCLASLSRSASSMPATPMAAAQAIDRLGAFFEQPVPLCESKVVELVDNLGNATSVRLMPGEFMCAGSIMWGSCRNFRNSEAAASTVNGVVKDLDASSAATQVRRVVEMANYWPRLLVSIAKARRKAKVASQRKALRKARKHH